jgi:hypothetical protein
MCSSLRGGGYRLAPARHKARATVNVSFELK